MKVIYLVQISYQIGRAVHCKALIMIIKKPYADYYSLNSSELIVVAN